MAYTDDGRLQRIYDLLSNFQGIDTLKKLLWTELSYARVDQPLSRDGWPGALRDSLAEDPTLFASGGQDDDFHVIYVRLTGNRLLTTTERPVIERLLRTHPYSLFVFSDSNQQKWHFVNVKHEDDVERRKIHRRITVGSGERLRTATERIAMLDLSFMKNDLVGLSPFGIQKRHDEAFDVDKVSLDFYKHYKHVFDLLQRELRRRTSNAQWAHDYSLLFLNRLVFLYFIQRKKWIGNDPDFIANYWRQYKLSGQPVDTFFQLWVSVLFFEAFNNQFQGGRADRQHIPVDIRDALATAPYLNGGMFRKNKLDDQYQFIIPDSLFETLFDRFDGTSPGFLERYNFTISEDTPLDKEVAVDPEVLGKVYESLVNITAEGIAETDQQGEAGIFYTERVEIDLMCRLTVVDWLANHMGQDVKILLYRAVFAYAPDEKDTADDALAVQGLWAKLCSLLDHVTVLDPACGSGSFLVGMLMVLDDLRVRANSQLGRNETAYDRRKRIIGNSLYGVDCMEFAVHMAELRLWLQLVVETELAAFQLTRDPLLPSLTFKIRHGDSLVQELGGVNLGLHAMQLELSAGKKDLEKLKDDKYRFFMKDNPAAFLTEESLKREEIRIFMKILQSSEHKLRMAVSELDKKLHAVQVNLMSAESHYAITGPERKALEEKREALCAELSNLHSALESLQHVEGKPPFVWDIAFVEIFGGADRGFDIVVGNPPYVRQEKLSNPLPERGWDKALYKAKLQRSAYAAYPDFFGYKPQKDSDPLNPSKAVVRKIDGKSDLYIFFYLHGLSLLNDKGSFCFITSNSWLDVGYGADLQELLLRQGHVKLIMDNQAKRSFSNAEVNTVIALLSTIKEKRDCGLRNTARFVMFKVPFENVLSPVIFEEIEEAEARADRPEYKVMPMQHDRLLKAGMAVPDRDDVVSSRSPVFEGDKWGGKYLRAPDIYWTILERAKDNLIPLSKTAQVRFGIKSGCNDFFYPNPDRIRQWGIEKEFLRPVIKSPRDYYSITIEPIPAWLFWCKLSRKELTGTRALAYIQWGESQGFDQVPSCKSRKNWYSLNGPECPSLLWPSAFFERHIVYQCPEGYVADKVFYTLSGSIPESVAAFLNSSVVSLMVEVEGYQLNHGGIFVTTEWLENLPVLKKVTPEALTAYEAIARRNILLCSDEQMQPDRRALDLEVLRSLGFEDNTEVVLSDMYDSIRTYVSGRIHKANRETTKSGRTKTGSMS